VSEIYRLRASSKKRDILKEIFPIEEIEKFLNEFNPDTIHLIYDLRRKNEDHASTYFSHIEEVLFKYFGANLEKNFLIPGETNVVNIRIKCKDLKKIFPILIDEEREFNFADQLYILKFDGKKVIKSMIVGRKNYYKYLEKPSPNPVKIDKIPYRGRTTVENEEEMKIAKKVLLDYFDSNPEVLDCLFEDACGKVGFEKLMLPGKEDHIHWRRKVNDHFEEFEIKSGEDFKKLVEGEDASCFYPSLTKVVNFKGRLIKVKHKFVCEYDPPEILRKDKKGMEIVAKISDMANSLFEELGIPSIYLFSGSKSARNQCFIDYESVLENLEKIKKDFPFLGYAFPTKPKGIEDEYRNIVSKSFNSALYLEFVRKLYKNNLLKRMLNERQILNVTHNPRSKFRAVSILVDFPHAVSIGMGSPKKILREKERGKLTFLGCAPIEKYPLSEEEMLNFKLENISDSFKKNYQNILKNMERKIEVKTLEKIFERFIEREREFFDFQVLKEEKFMEKYYNFYY
jgi:hypothetical protein